VSRQISGPVGRGEELVLQGDDFSAEQPQDLHFVVADIVAEIEFRAIAPRGCDGGQADAGVAARDVDNQVAGSKLAGFLRISDDCPSDAVLDAPGRIEEFELGDDSSMQVPFSRVIVELEEGRVADQIF
jgi:hypothetical protein